MGTKPYDGYPDADEYFAKFYADHYEIREQRDKFYEHLPVYSGGNILMALSPMTERKITK